MLSYDKATSLIENGSSFTDLIIEYIRILGFPVVIRDISIYSLGQAFIGFVDQEAPNVQKELRSILEVSVDQLEEYIIDYSKELRKFFIDIVGREQDLEEDLQGEDSTFINNFNQAKQGQLKRRNELEADSRLGIEIIEGDEYRLVTEDKILVRIGRKDSKVLVSVGKNKRAANRDFIKALYRRGQYS